MSVELQPHPTKIIDVLLVRHGQTDWNAASRLMGHLPIALNETGKKQVRSSASLLSRTSVGCLVSSPMVRAVQTAEILREANGWNAEIQIHLGFAEFDTGDWTGEYLHDLRRSKDWGRYLRDPAGTRFPGGESVPEIQKRAVRALNELVAQSPGNLIIASHGGVVRLLLMAAYGAPLQHYQRTRVDNASVSLIRLIPGMGAGVRAVNVLPGPLDTL